MQIPAGQVARFAACHFAGPAGYFLFPALAVGAEIARASFGEDNAIVAALAAVSSNVCGNLTANDAQRIIEKLGQPGSNHDLAKVLIAAMSDSLEKARQGLTDEQEKQYKVWFDNWQRRFQWGSADAASVSDLFRGKEAFDPLRLASASAEDAWNAYRAALERWSWEQRRRESKVQTVSLASPNPLPDPLSAYLAESLPGYIQQAVPLVLRSPENRAGWIAWQQRFLETAYFEIRDMHEDLAKRIENLANRSYIPDLFEKLLKEIRDDSARQNGDVKEYIGKRLDRLEDDIALRLTLAQQRGEPPPKADPVPYLRTLWGRTQLIDLDHFQPPDAKVRQFFIDRLYTKLSTVIVEERQDRLAPLDATGRPGDLFLHEALKRHRLLLLVGDPGAGKTTFLRRIAFELCHVGLGRDREEPDGRSRPIERLMGCGWETLPILIDANTLANHIWDGGVPQRGALADPTNPQWIFDYLETAHRLGDGFFATEAERGCILLVDAFDEVPNEAHRRKIGELLKNFAAEEKYQKTRIVGTSRPGEHGGLTSIDQFQAAKIAPLGKEETSIFVKNWGAALYPAQEHAAATFTKTLSEEIRRPQVRILARNPMMLTALAVLHFVEKRRLPEQRSELYTYILEWLARRRVARKNDGGNFKNFLFKMGRLAMAMSTGKSKMRREIGVEEAIKVLENDFQGPQYRDPELRRHAVRTFLEEEETDSGMIIKSGSNVRFWHLTFREALTAKELVKDKQWKRVLFKRNKLYDRLWRETVLLLAGELMSSGGYEGVNDFLHAMLTPAEGQGAGLADRARCVGLMGLLLKDLDAWQYKMTDDLDARYKAMLAQVLEIFDKDKAYQIPFDDRLAAANALGMAGDPRLDPDRNNLVPFSGGRFLIGADGEDDNQPREETTAPFSIGRYPVTVVEYERFVEEGGYTNEDYWGAGGFGDTKEPDEWESQLEGPKNLPVTGVNWYEASAYCAWAKGRLPKEKEWEYAARANRPGVRYPWGDRDPDEMVNTRPANYGYDGSPHAATPVGLYPAGATPDGIEDMAGNVWEWVEDDYAGDGKSKVLRGGGWNSFAWNLRVSSRNWVNPIARVVNVGFRCVWE